MAGVKAICHAICSMHRTAATDVRNWVESILGDSTHTILNSIIDRFRSNRFFYWMNYCEVEYHCRVVNDVRTYDNNIQSPALQQEARQKLASKLSYKCMHSRPPPSKQQQHYSDLTIEVIITAPPSLDQINILIPKKSCSLDQLSLLYWQLRRLWWV